ncbi:MAG: hypothetical protein D6696_10285 [Acidobacteria bacterium]|nr:MAG: hypothetical protein D6696_10285 [Acidobacteriota bacterium]
MLTVEPEVWDRLPGMRIVVVEAGALTNFVPLPELEAELASCAAELRRGWRHDNPQSHPRLAPWRAAMKAIGAGKKQACSVEALVRRALQEKPAPEVSPLVDFYNLVSLRHLVPAGGWDADEIDYMLDAELELRFTRDGDRFRPLGAAEDEEVPVPAGELAYVAGDEVLTRHFVWRQSEWAKITPETARVVLVSEILPELGEGAAEEVRDALVAGLKRYFDAEARATIVQR